MTSSLPSGTVTFLFTDIEGSTKLAREHPDKWETLRERHHAILKSAIESHNGYVFQIIGDAFCAAFHTAGDALKAAIQSQQGLQIEPGDETVIRVRMGIHTGEAETDGRDYRGYLSLSLVQRVMSAGHGGQILLSDAAANLVRGQLPKDVTLRDMGGHNLKDVLLPVRIFQVAAPDLPWDFPPLRTPSVFPNNLPAQLTSFIGRDMEIREVKDHLTSQRLVTLTGSGGTGKTRLSLKVAADLLETFPDGAWFVELAPIFDPALVPDTVASVLRVREEPGHPLMTSLIDWLKNRELLLILDNCEHLIEACAQFTDSILQSCRGTRILASSREALGIAGEIACRVPSLPTPNLEELRGTEEFEKYASVQLFMERARQAKPDLKLTEGNGNVIAQICQRLDGIPLAIELAAARVKVLTVEQIAVRLDDRFRLLTGGSRTALPRQQTLRALIDWSYDLLNEPEQESFRRLAVFVGGWTLEAAEAVCGWEGIEPVEILDLLTRLVDKSLVVVDVFGGDIRYRTPETIRQYARARLFETGEVARLRDRHLEYFLQFAEGAERELQGRGQKRWLRRLERDHDNLRTALEWSLKSKPDFGLRIAAALREFWDTHGHLTEARRWLDAMLNAAINQPPDSTRVKALVAAMGFASRQTDLADWISFLDQGLALAREIGDKWGIAQFLTARGLYKEYFGNDSTGAESLYLEVSRLARELDDKLLIGQSLGPLASCALKRYEYGRAESLYRESLGLFRQVENEKEIAGALGNLAEVAFTRRDYGFASACAEESLALYQELEDKHGIATALRTLARTLQNLGRIEQAQISGEQSVCLFRELSDLGCLGIALPIHARSVMAGGNAEDAVELTREAVTILHEVGDKVSECAALEVLGRIALAQGDASNAQAHFRKGLTLLREINDAGEVPSLIEGLGSALASFSQSQDAILLLGAADALRKKTGLAITELERPEYDRIIALLHAQMDLSSFHKTWEKGRAMTMEQAIDLALSST